MRHFKECSDCPYPVERFFGCENCKIAKEKDEKVNRVSKGTDESISGRVLPSQPRGFNYPSLERQIKEVKQ